MNTEHSSNQRSSTAMRVFIYKNGEQLGPFTLDEVLAKEKAGEIFGGDKAWADGETEWVPWASLKESIESKFLHAARSRKKTVLWTAGVVLCLIVIGVLGSVDDKRSKRPQGQTPPSSADSSERKPFDYARLSRELSENGYRQAPPPSDAFAAFRKVPGNLSVFCSGSPSDLQSVMYIWDTTRLRARINNMDRSVGDESMEVYILCAASTRTNWLVVKAWIDTQMEKSLLADVPRGLLVSTTLGGTTMQYEYDISTGKIYIFVKR